MPDDAERLAALDEKGDVFQGEEVAVAARPVEGQQFREAVAGRIVDRVALGNFAEFDGVHGKDGKTSVAEVGGTRGAESVAKRIPESKRKGRPPAPPVFAVPASLSDCGENRGANA